MKKILTLICAAVWVLTAKASAQVRMEGDFTALKSCPALLSIKKGTNPGNVSVAAGSHYAVKGKNRDQASHYWIMVPGAQPAERWVAVGCGAVGGAIVVVPPVPAGSKGESRSTKLEGGPFYVLALSWEPAFCEALPNKTECQTQTADRADARQFSLHGLWPQPRRNVFCGVAQKDVDADGQHRWADLPEPNFAATTKAALDAVMPGTQSMLERHEWIKHGTCYPAKSADQYFSDAVKLTNAINESAVGAFLAAHVGQDVRTLDLLSKFDEALFTGAGSRVRVACKPSGGRQLITEITIGLKGDIPGGAAIADLIKAAAPTDSGCPHGVLDPAGLQ